MKEAFSYSPVPDPEVFEKGRYHGIDYVIIDGGVHPCAYVELVGGLHSGLNLDSVPVHGGITYTDIALWDDTDNRIYFGWDYSHYGDFNGWVPNCKGKKWTPAEVLEEVKQAIDAVYTLEWYRLRVENHLRAKDLSDEEIDDILSDGAVEFSRTNDLTPEECVGGITF